MKLLYKVDWVGGDGVSPLYVCYQWIKTSSYSGNMRKITSCCVFRGNNYRLASIANNFSCCNGRHPHWLWSQMILDNCFQRKKTFTLVNVNLGDNGTQTRGKCFNLIAILRAFFEVIWLHQVWSDSKQSQVTSTISSVCGICVSIRWSDKIVPILYGGKYNDFSLCFIQEKLKHLKMLKHGVRLRVFACSIWL